MLKFLDEFTDAIIVGHSLFHNPLADERGASLVEYVLLLSSLALVISMSVASVGERTEQTFAKAGAGMGTSSGLHVFEGGALGGGGFGHEDFGGM